MGLTGLSGWRWLHIGRRGDRLPQEIRRQLLDALQVKGVEELEGENNLLKLNLTVGPFEDSGTTGDGQIRILVGQVRPLHRYVTIVSEIEAVYGLVPVSFLPWNILYQHAYPRCYSQPLLQVSRVDLQFNIV